MIYITGQHSLNLECDLETTGDWHTSALAWKKITFADSEKMFFKEYGIEYPKKIPTEDKNYYIANHIRAILDCMELGNFAVIQGMKDELICNDHYTMEIFDKVYQMRVLKNWRKIDSFMGSEYYMEWENYKKEKGAIMMDMFLIVTEWNWVDEVGLPKDTEEDFDWYYIFTDYGSVEVAGYRADNKEFYGNFGYGGCVTDENNVLAWSKLGNTSLIDKETFYERYGITRKITLTDLKKYDLLPRDGIEKENFLNSNKQTELENHNSRFKMLLERDNTNDRDNEKKALFWILAGNTDLYNKVNLLYDFQNNEIMPENLENGSVDLSSSARALVNLGYNLYNGYKANHTDILSIMSSLDSDNFELAIKGIRIRFNRA